MSGALNGPQWLADGVAVMMLLAGAHALLRVLRPRPARVASDYAVDVAATVFSIALLGLLVPSTHLAVGTGARIWVAVVCVATAVTAVTALYALKTRMNPWKYLPIPVIGMATAYLLAAPWGVSTPGAGATRVSALGDMSASQMAGMNADRAMVPGATIDLFLAIAMIAIIVVLVDRASANAVGGDWGVGQGTPGLLAAMTGAQSAMIANAGLALGCAYLLVMYFV